MSQHPPDILARSATALAWWRSTDGASTSSILGTGAIRRLEDLGAQHLGHEFAISVSSGTFALRAALAAVGVRSGDEVVVPLANWHAADAAVVSLGATPIPADVTGASLALDPAAARLACTPRTTAVVVAHLFGVPVDVAELRSHLPAGMPIVEDVAQALGAAFDGRPAGSTGDIAICSFGPGKIVDAGEGGLAATSDPDLFDRMVRATQHPAGQQARGVAFGGSDALMARIHPVAAVLACHEFERLPDELADRRSERGRAADLVARVCPDAVLPAGIAGASGRSFPIALPPEPEPVPAVPVRSVLDVGTWGRALRAAGLECQVVLPRVRPVPDLGPICLVR